MYTGHSRRDGDEDSDGEVNQLHDLCSWLGPVQSISENAVMNSGLG